MAYNIFLKLMGKMSQKFITFLQKEHMSFYRFSKFSQHRKFLIKVHIEYFGNVSS